LQKGDIEKAEPINFY